MTTIEGTAKELPPKKTRLQRIKELDILKAFKSQGDKSKTAYKLVIGTGVGLALLVTGFEIGSGVHNKHLNFPVDYTADPKAPAGTYDFGKPGNRFSVKCQQDGSQMCRIHIEQGNKETDYSFPYVEQEWFNPKHDNTPYHSIDEIKVLPSYTGNPQLRMTKDITANNRVLDILAQNGWIRTESNKTDTPSK